jgi:hypothetical protein
MAGMTAPWTCGFVRPDHVTLGIGDGENVLTVRGANEHKALSLNIESR